MFIRQLEYLVTLAKEKHFAHAAEICCVTQPALSTAIRNLEEELGIPIVKRGRRYEGLTPEGEHILKYAHQTLAAWKGMQQAAAISKISGEIRIGVIPTALHVVALLTGAFISSNIDIHEHVQTMSMEKIISALARYEIDLGIGYISGPPEPGTRYLSLFKETFVLVAQKTSEIAQRDSLSWSEAAELPLCLLADELQNRMQINAAFKRANVKPRIVLETNSPMTLYTHVRSAGLYSILPQSQGIFSMPPGLDDVVRISLTPTVDNAVGLISLDKEPRSPMVEAAWKQAKSFGDSFVL
ncbi:LysR substrate-binding domain-containing protein [Oxalobacter vibrioformis]|uniref:LysR substrate-binding domain-containing protein n=1 Tax=Oxalobacter vibrioformis TaxID=933080 RepID=A0A9E9P4C9_9BURK|nr:LysR substrate-binding domain-containing protein [Oxalobacter vibrioformis]NLC24601.1 LysR family transcriptional regulator [Oxalobacter sp.]WAW10963.1 LysR substrate-binding domain-containing protein [Oxalobacter vibrioformis]